MSQTGLDTAVQPWGPLLGAWPGVIKTLVHTKGHDGPAAVPPPPSPPCQLCLLAASSMQRLSRPIRLPSFLPPFECDTRRGSTSCPGTPSFSFQRKAVSQLKLYVRFHPFSMAQVTDTFYIWAIIFLKLLSTCCL